MLAAVRAKGLLPAFVLLAGGVTAAGCSIPDTSQRGFGSRQVLHVREEGLGLRSFSYDLSAIYLAHTVPDIMTASGVSAPYDRTLLDLTTGVDRPIAPAVVQADLLASADGIGRTLVLQHFTDDASIPSALTTSSHPFLTLTFLDEVAGTAVDVTGVRALDVSLGGTRIDPILVGRQDEEGMAQPWYGPPEALIPMANVNFVVGRDHQGFIALTNGGESQQQFMRFPFNTAVPATIVSPGAVSMQEVVAADATPAGPATLATLPRNNVTPVIYCPPVGAGPVPSCLLFYDRDFMDGSSAGFVRFLDTGREMQLPGQSTNHLADTMSISPSGQDMYWLQTENAGGQTRVYTWHVGDAKAASCTIPRTADRRDFSQSAWQPGTGRFAVVSQSSSQSASSPASWTLVEGTAGVGCQMVASGNNQIKQIQFSPSGQQIALLESDPQNMSTIYLGAPDGSAPTAASTGNYYFNIGYLDDRHLLLWHSNTDGYTLSWLDTATIPAMEHAIADRVRWDARGAWAWLTPKWVLLADADLQQDGSYSLDVVNIETGEERLVSRGVVDFRTSWTQPPSGATELLVAYTVRSRTASSQDGIWVAHLPLTQFADNGSPASQ
jgi:hypothetical protein